MFLYLARRRINPRRKMPAVIAVGINAAPMAAKEVEPELR